MLTPTAHALGHPDCLGPLLPPMDSIGGASTVILHCNISPQGSKQAEGGNLLECREERKNGRKTYVLLLYVKRLHHSPQEEKQLINIAMGSTVLERDRLRPGV